MSTLTMPAPADRRASAPPEPGRELSCTAMVPCPEWLIEPRQTDTPRRRGPSA
jgi:hypothetical protein